MKKIDKLVAKHDRLLQELDLISQDLKLLHIEYAYLREISELKKKLVN